MGSLPPGITGKTANVSITEKNFILHSPFMLHTCLPAAVSSHRKIDSHHTQNSEGSKLKRQIRRRFFLQNVRREERKYFRTSRCLSGEIVHRPPSHFFFNSRRENMHSLHQRRAIKEGGGGNYFNTPGKHGNFFSVGGEGRSRILQGPSSFSAQANRNSDFLLLLFLPFPSSPPKRSPKPPPPRLLSGFIRL